MARYIDADELYSRVKTKTNPYGKPTLDYESGVKVLDMIKNTPTADVVPKSELEISQHLLKEAWKRIEELDNLVQDGTRLEQENETLKDNNEHLAVILEETKAEVERLKAQKDALIKNYAECMKDYASEIFAEIESAKVSIGDFKIKTFKIISLGKVAEQTITGDVVAFSDIAELKKEYTKGKPIPAPEEKFFSPQDVRKMTPKEVHENYTAIRRSMERWYT